MPFLPPESRVYELNGALLSEYAPTISTGRLVELCHTVWRWGMSDLEADSRLGQEVVVAQGVVA